MKSYLNLILGCLLLSSCNPARQTGLTRECCHTIRLDSTDTPESLVEKAAHIVPKPTQLAALRNEFIAFIHFGPNTFTRMEWGNGMEDPRVFDLKELDTDQWCEAMKAAGMTMVIFTAKHHDGFVLWQSRYTDHGIMSSGFRDGKGDILKDLSSSCRKYGLKLGVYLSPADLYQIEQPDGLYGNQSAYSLRTIPREVAGRPFANQTTFEFELDDYNEYFMNQLFELLTEYGPIHEVWFDGAHPKRKGGQRYNYQAWKQLIHALAPEAVIFGREDVRWCGNESGKTRDTEWNVVPYAADPDTLSQFDDMTDDDLGSRVRLAGGRYLHYQQAETNTSIREGWFYRDDDHQRVRSADDVFDIYERAVGGNSTFLLNIPPNREGRFSAQDVAVLQEVGKRIHHTYGKSLLDGARGAAELLDGDEQTYLLTEAGGEGLIFETSDPVTVNRFLIQEAIGTHGERVEKHALDAWIDGAWKEIAKGTNVGYKRILRFPDVTSRKFRLRILEARLQPALCRVGAYCYEARPPRLEVSRNSEGLVTIDAMQQQFGWKTYAQDIARSLNAGFRIYYTTDGTDPDKHATEYTGPFTLDNGVVKAVAVLNGEAGEVCETRMGYLRDGWKLEIGMSGRWLTIQMDNPHKLSGLMYTPPMLDNRPMRVTGSVEVSDDGIRWRSLETFEFGNLKNDPTRRFHHFGQSVTALYVRVKADCDIALPATEFDLF